MVPQVKTLILPFPTVFSMTFPVHLFILRIIKAFSHADFKRIPIVVLTTSRAEEDILRTYDLGANSFITKPVTFESLVHVVQVLGNYWVEIVELPGGKSSAAA